MASSLLETKLNKPNLRFKDANGNDFPDWDNIQISKLLKYEQPSRYIVHTTEYDDSYEIPVLTAGKTFILGYTQEKDGVFEKDKLPVIIFDDFTTATKLVDFPFKVKSSAIKILINRDESLSNTYFLFCAISIVGFSLGAEHKRYWISEYSKIKIKLPSLQEQQKIANFLMSVDNWIYNLKAQKESLEKYKKGMMQKIFSREIRFKDDNGNDFPDWVEMSLKKVLKERNEYSTKDNGFTHISLTKSGVVPKTERYNRDFLVTDDLSKNYKVTRLNDLCYNPANLKFGVISINKWGDGIFSPIYVTFEIINQNIDFIGYYLTRNSFINKARKYEQGTVYERMAVSPADLMKVKVFLPVLQEQIKIADFLSSIDSQIDIKQRQIEHAELWKKGLMQEMFV